MWRQKNKRSYKLFYKNKNKSHRSIIWLFNLLTFVLLTQNVIYIVAADEAKVIKNNALKGLRHSSAVGGVGDVPSLTFSPSSSLSVSVSEAAAGAAAASATLVKRDVAYVVDSNVKDITNAAAASSGSAADGLVAVVDDSDVADDMMLMDKGVDLSAYANDFNMQEETSIPEDIFDQEHIKDADDMSTAIAGDSNDNNNHDGAFDAIEKDDDDDDDNDDDDHIVFDAMDRVQYAAPRRALDVTFEHQKGTQKNFTFNVASIPNNQQYTKHQWSNNNNNNNKYSNKNSNYGRKGVNYKSKSYNNEEVSTEEAMVAYIDNVDGMQSNHENSNEGEYAEERSELSNKKKNSTKNNIGIVFDIKKFKDKDIGTHEQNEMGKRKKPLTYARHTEGQQDPQLDSSETVLKSKPKSIVQPESVVRERKQHQRQSQNIEKLNERKFNKPNGAMTERNEFKLKKDISYDSTDALDNNDGSADIGNINIDSINANKYKDNNNNYNDNDDANDYDWYRKMYEGKEEVEVHEKSVGHKTTNDGGGDIDDDNFHNEDETFVAFGDKSNLQKNAKTNKKTPHNKDGRQQQQQHKENLDENNNDADDLSEEDKENRKAALSSVTDSQESFANFKDKQMMAGNAEMAATQKAPPTASPSLHNTKERRKVQRFNEFIGRKNKRFNRARTFNSGDRVEHGTILNHNSFAYNNYNNNNNNKHELQEHQNKQQLEQQQSKQRKHDEDNVENAKEEFEVVNYNEDENDEDDADAHADDPDDGANAMKQDLKQQIAMKTTTTSRAPINSQKVQTDYAISHLKSNSSQNTQHNNDWWWSSSASSSVSSGDSSDADKSRVQESTRDSYDKAQFITEYANNAESDVKNAVESRRQWHPSQQIHLGAEQKKTDQPQSQHQLNDSAFELHKAHRRNNRRSGHRTHKKHYKDYLRYVMAKRTSSTPSPTPSAPTSTTTTATEAIVMPITHRNSLKTIKDNDDVTATKYENNAIFIVNATTMAELTNKAKDHNQMQHDVVDYEQQEFEKVRNTNIDVNYNYNYNNNNNNSKNSKIQIGENMLKDKRIEKLKQYAKKLEREKARQSPASPIFVVIASNVNDTLEFTETSNEELPSGKIQKPTTTTTTATVTTSSKPFYEGQISYYVETDDGDDNKRDRDDDNIYKRLNRMDKDIQDSNKNNNNNNNNNWYRHISPVLRNGIKTSIIETFNNNNNNNNNDGLLQHYKHYPNARSQQNYQHRQHQQIQSSKSSDDVYNQNHPQDKHQQHHHHHHHNNKNNDHHQKHHHHHHHHHHQQQKHNHADHQQQTQHQRRNQQHLAKYHQSSQIQSNPYQRKLLRKPLYGNSAAVGMAKSTVAKATGKDTQQQQQGSSIVLPPTTATIPSSLDDVRTPPPILPAPHYGRGGAMQELGHQITEMEELERYYAKWPHLARVQFQVYDEHYHETHPELYKDYDEDYESAAELEEAQNSDSEDANLPPYIKKYNRRNKQLLNLLEGTLPPPTTPPMTMSNGFHSLLQPGPRDSSSSLATVRLDDDYMKAKRRRYHNRFGSHNTNTNNKNSNHDLFAQQRQSLQPQQQTVAPITPIALSDAMTPTARTAIANHIPDDDVSISRESTEQQQPEADAILQEEIETKLNSDYNSRADFHSQQNSNSASNNNNNNNENVERTGNTEMNWQIKNEKSSSSLTMPSPTSHTNSMMVASQQALTPKPALFRLPSYPGIVGNFLSSKPRSRSAQFAPSNSRVRGYMQMQNDDFYSYANRPTGGNAITSTASSASQSQAGSSHSSSSSETSSSSVSSSSSSSLPLSSSSALASASSKPLSSSSSAGATTIASASQPISNKSINSFVYHRVVDTAPRLVGAGSTLGRKQRLPFVAITDRRLETSKKTSLEREKDFEQNHYPMP